MNFKIKVLVVLLAMFRVRGLSQVPNCATPQNTAEEFTCARRMLSSAEQEMKRTLRAAMDTFTPNPAELSDESHMNGFDRAEAVRYRATMKSHLKSSQIAWLYYRNAACAAVLAKYEGGTAGPTAELGCREVMTRERTSHLRSDYLPEQ